MLYSAIEYGDVDGTFSSLKHNWFQDQNTTNCIGHFSTQRATLCPILIQSPTFTMTMSASAIDPSLISLNPTSQGTGTQPLRTSKPSLARKAPIKPKRGRIVRRKKSGPDRLRNCPVYKTNRLGRPKLTRSAPGCKSRP
jgi:hypothetical protein